MSLRSGANITLGSGLLDLLDLIIRIEARDEIAGNLSARERRAYAHYAQITATAVGTSYLISRDRLLYYGINAIKQLGIQYQPPLESILRTEISGAAAELLELFTATYNQMSLGWELGETENDTSRINPEVDILTLLPEQSVIVVSEQHILRVGFRAICEMQGRCIEYNARHAAFLSELRKSDGAHEELSANDRLRLSRTIIPSEFTVADAIQDFPLMYAIKHHWEPVNVGPTFASICAWIVLLEDNDAGPAEIGKHFLSLFSNPDLAHRVYMHERINSKCADAYNLERMANAVCAANGLRPFSQMLDEQSRRLQGLIDSVKPEEPSKRPATPLYWYLMDGLEHLKMLRRNPGGFFLLGPSSEPIFPNPLIFRGSRMISASRGQQEQSQSQHDTAVLKELLFSGHTISWAEERFEYDIKAQCPFGGSCMIGNSVGPESDRHLDEALRFILHS